MDKPVTTLYRYEDGWYDDDTYYGGKNLSKIYLHRFQVLRETPCGYWIRDIGEKWVSKDGRKRFAYDTKELALNSYKIRKKWRINYCRSALEKAQVMLKVAEATVPEEGL